MYILIRPAIMFGPVMFTLIGIGCGICLAMLFRHDPQGGAHVLLEDSMPFALAGAIGGASLILLR